MKILKNGRREGFSFNFDEGFRFDQQGNLRLEGPQSGVVPYSHLWVTTGNPGDSARIVRSINADAFKIISTRFPVSRAYYLLKKTRSRDFVSHCTQLHFREAFFG